MFSAIWSSRWYLLLAFTSLLIFFVALTPLHFIWSFVEDEVQQLPVTIEQPSGTLWSGRTRLTSNNAAMRFEPTAVGWQVSPWRLLMGRLNLHLSIDSESVRIQGLLSGKLDFASRQPQFIQIDELGGYIDSSLLTPILNQQGARVTGSIELTDVGGRYNWAQRQIDQLAGQMSYSGGDIDFVANQQRVKSEIPAVFGALRMIDSVAEIAFSQLDSSPLARAYIQPDGWGGVAVRRRTLDIVGQKWQDDSATADTVVFEVSQKIL